MISDIYKNRRGKWKDIRIWRCVDLGTCRVIDCFVTNGRNEIIDFNSLKIQVKQANHSGGFMVTPKKDEENIGEMVRLEDYGVE